mgnify:CR=1 FL=1
MQLPFQHIFDCICNYLKFDAISNCVVSKYTSVMQDVKRKNRRFGKELFNSFNQLMDIKFE